MQAGLHACGACVDPRAPTPRVRGTSKTSPLALPPPKLAFLAAEPRNATSLDFFSIINFFLPFRIQSEMILSDSRVTIRHTHQKTNKKKKSKVKVIKTPANFSAQSALDAHAKRGFGGSSPEKKGLLGWVCDWGGNQ